MMFHQISYESPALFLIFQAYFQERDFLSLEEAAFSQGVSEEHYKQFIAYVSGFYGNMSNYHNFGDMKFVPEISSEVFLQILRSNPLYGDEDACYKEVVDELYPQVETEIFAVDKPFTQLNYPEDGGITGYFGRNMTKEDLAKVDKFAASQNIDVLNTRAFKQGDKYILTVGSIDKTKSQTDIEFEGNKFDISYGEFNPYLKECHYYV